MAIPKPEPQDWIRANARELHATDREVLAMLRDSSRRVNELLQDLVARDRNLISDGVRRAQLEQTRSLLLAEQGRVFERLGDLVSARRAKAAARSARLSAAADAALLRLVGKGAEAQYLYDSALVASQRSIDVALARMRLSALPLSERIYRSNLWMDGRLGKLINETLASGLNAREFAKRARDWFSPSTPGGIRYAAMRLARTEINNSFHAISAQKYAETPWINRVEWNLSGSHPTPDECNVLADASPYESDETPARPHPQCLCYITPESVDEDEFIENFLKGDYDDYLDKELEEKGWNVKEDPKPEPVKPPAEYYVPATLRNHPGITNDFDKQQAMGMMFGYGSETDYNAKARELTPDQMLDSSVDFQVRQILLTSYAPDKLQFLRSVDEQFAEKTGQPNNHFFEISVVEYLKTPEGAAKAAEVDGKLLDAVKAQEKVDALTRIAEQLNGAQPELPADSSQFESWSPQKAKQTWEEMLRDQPLTDDEKKGLRFYSTSPGYSAMNGKLRGTRTLTEKEKAKADEGIRQTQSALRPNTTPLLVTRLTNGEQFKDLGGTGKRVTSLTGLVGKTVKDKGFVSTAVQGGSLSAGDVKLDIEVPVGVPMAYMESITRHKGEHEMLLSRDLEFKILRVEVESDKRVNIRARIVNWPGKES